MTHNSINVMLVFFRPTLYSTIASDSAIKAYNTAQINPMVLPVGVQEGFFNDAYHVRSIGNNMPERLNNKYTIIKTKIAEKIIFTSKLFF